MVALPRFLIPFLFSGIFSSAWAINSPVLDPSKNPSFACRLNRAALLEDRSLPFDRRLVLVQDASFCSATWLSPRLFLTHRDCLSIFKSPISSFEADIYGHVLINCRETASDYQESVEIQLSSRSPSTGDLVILEPVETDKEISIASGDGAQATAMKLQAWNPKPEYQECRSAGFGIELRTQEDVENLKVPYRLAVAKIQMNPPHAEAPLFFGFADGSQGRVQRNFDRSDMGGPIYCRKTSSSPWLIVGVNGGFKPFTNLSKTGKSTQVSVDVLAPVTDALRKGAL